MVRIFMRKVKEHPVLTELKQIVPGYREEIDGYIDRFKNLDFGELDDEELEENTKVIAEEEGVLLSRYFTSWGVLGILTNMDTKITTLCFQRIIPNGPSHFGF